jgi:hypothetical protein
LKAELHRIIDDWIVQIFRVISDEAVKLSTLDELFNEGPAFINHLHYLRLELFPTSYLGVFGEMSASCAVMKLYKHRK